MPNERNRNGHALLPNNDSHKCFGCSPVNSSGLQMKFYVNEQMDMVTSWLSVPVHLSGWANIIHGGITSTILDETMGWAGLIVLRKLVIAKSLSVDFIKPLFVGEEIKSEGRVQKINSEREAIIAGTIYNADNEVCAKSTSTAALFTVEALRKLGVADESMLRSLEQMLSISSFDELNTRRTLA